MGIKISTANRKIKALEKKTGEQALAISRLEHDLRDSRYRRTSAEEDARQARAFKDEITYLRTLLRELIMNSFAVRPHD